MQGRLLLFKQILHAALQLQSGHDLVSAVVYFLNPNEHLYRLVDT